MTVPEITCFYLLHIMTLRMDSIMDRHNLFSRLLFGGIYFFIVTQKNASWAILVYIPLWKRMLVLIG